MSHIIYQTEGIILKKKNFGEADRLLTIFTKEFGKINAMAQGVRYLKSKLRYNLEPFSYSKLGLVAGKSALAGWRIVDAEEIENYKNIIFKQDNFLALSQIINFIDRMIQGEEKNIFLWEKLKEIFNFLNIENYNKENLQNFEISSFFDILKNLGYIDIESYKTNKEGILIINKAIKESML
ncbi:DNA repair protein RecO [Patescibacteria group bacterium]|nr:DNA repair protein RecO [Patescibacteria group bacterium]